MNDEKQCVEAQVEWRWLDIFGNGMKWGAAPPKGAV